jgi:hypothetical protein
MIIGLISIFVDPKKNKIGLGLTVARVLVAAALTLVFNVQESRARDLALDESKQREKETAASLLKLIEQTRPIPDLVSMLRDFGFSGEKAETATAASVPRSLDANRVYQGLLATRRGGESGIRVEYFPKDVDVKRWSRP